MLLSPSSKSRTYTGLVKMGEPARFRRTPGFCPRLYGHGSTRLKLSQAPEHRQHEAAMRGCRVRPCALKRTEAGLRLRHRVQHIEQVPRRSRQPIKPRHDQHAAGLDFCRRRYQPKRPPIANNRPGSPEFAQERDNRSKKAKFIFREIGSIRATRLSPQPPPRNRVSRGRSLLGGDRPPFQTGRPFKEQLALTAVACMPDEHSVPALMTVALRSAMARTGRQREVG